MDTNTSKTPATLPLAAWQQLPAAEVAREVHARIARLAPPLRAAALAWLRPETELASALDVAASKLAPTAKYGLPLHGVPYLLKDLFDLAGVPTRAGSTFLDQVRPLPQRDSTFVQRLAEFGAACAGKTHLVEFASGLTGENPHYGDCPHPGFPDRLSGGSSSGSAALVAAGVAPLAIGTDTGGSVRVPAAWCGLHGFRLTPRDPFIADAFPLAPTMDTAGWFTVSAGDMLATWTALVGPAGPRRRGRGCHLPMAALLPSPDRETARACDAAMSQLGPEADRATAQGLLHAWRDCVDAYVTIGMSEAHAVHRDWLAPYREHYDPVIWQRFTEAGRFPSERVAAARAKLAEVRAVFRDFFAAGFDFLVLPSVPGPAPRKPDCTPELRRRILTLTAPASLAGLPLLALPVPLPSGLTAGLQVILPDPASPVVPQLLG
jgi:amidase/aspartyl-tRNA(Asn)/glutamyl-tRNA(Gln) amidotransferase subunit A